MARKNVLYSYKFFDNEVVSSSTNSSVSEVSQLDQASIALTWSSSTLVATAQIEVKNGEKDSYRTLDFGSAITISGASGSHEIILLAMPFTHLRMSITVTSGSGTINAVITAKSVGA